MKQLMTTEQLARQAVKQMKAMSADEKVKRARLDREFGPSKLDSLAEAARRVAEEESAMDKIQ
jgi:hypothetical protein